MIQDSNYKPVSELRFNLVCKDWVAIAVGRARRPETFVKEKKREEETPTKDCPFCHIETQEPPLLSCLDKNDRWLVVAIPNKFPAFSHGDRLNERAEGPYSIMDGIGFHEVVITRDHKHQMAELSAGEIKQVIDAYQERYLKLMTENLVNYISIFHNHGREAGASIAHPHSQIIAMPIMDPDLQRSLNGSRDYFRARGKCVHCAMMEWDIEDGRRIVFENEKFVVLCPFASKVAFEVRVYPKEHRPYFEKIKEDEKQQFAEALGVALNKIFKGLNDPAYNFYIHTGPCDGKNYDHYHWHLVILPKTSVWAGFELGAGMEILTIEPEKAAEYLREI